MLHLTTDGQTYFPKRNLGKGGLSVFYFMPNGVYQHKKREEHKIKIKCKKCNKEFLAWQGNNRKYCSLECYWKDLSLLYKGEKTNFWKGGKVIKKCLNCKKEFEIHPSMDRIKFCSRQCFKEYKISTECFKGEKNRLWKGGYKNHIHNNRKYRVRKLKAQGSHTLEEWEELKKKYNYMCLCCKRQEPEITLSEDHIIPLSKGGSDNIENIQPLCRSCNSIKYNKIINYLTFPKQIMEKV